MFVHPTKNSTGTAMRYQAALSHIQLKTLISKQVSCFMYTGRYSTQCCVSGAFFDSGIRDG
jgi:hypothetical protein